MTRSDLQQLTDLRIREAKLLLDNGYFQGAYYLCGYAVECALKACIVKSLIDQWPDKNLLKEINKIHSHDLATLLRFTGLLKAELEKEIITNPTFGAAWRLALQWGPDDRYELGMAEKDASDFFEAITGANGIVSWLRTKW